MKDPSGSGRVSVVVCARETSASSAHEAHVADTVGAPHEYILVDNSRREYSLCSAYNEGVERSCGDIVAFVHDDVTFRTDGWGATLRRKFATYPEVGLVGVVGSSYLMKEFPAWSQAGPPFVRGHVIHHDRAAGRDRLSEYDTIREDSEVVVVDGLFFAIRRALFEQIRFDDYLFDGFHLYDGDISMQVRQTHRLLVTWDILVRHVGEGRYDRVWRNYAAFFSKKWEASLPASCADRSLTPQAPVRPSLPRQPDRER